jgi:hypothetical protein
MQRIHRLSARVKAVLLLVTGLVVGAWHSYGIATGSRPASPEPRLVFEIITLLTLVWMLIWTLVRRANGDKDG